MSQYARVSYAVRCQIYAFLQIELSIPEITKRLGFHKTTIYREIKGNSLNNKYEIQRAENRAYRRRLKCRRHKILKCELLEKVKAKLNEDWSPEQITQRFRLEAVPIVCHETIYKFMRKRKNHRYFRHYNRRGYSRYSRIRMRRESCLSIHQRPKIANERLRIGDWERDSMNVGKEKVLVCTDRKTRFTRLEAYTSFTAEDINKKTLRMIKPLGYPVHTITNDNGPEFRGKQSSEVPVYYCDPRKPQQRGTVENTIGILRKRLRLKTDIKSLGKNGLSKIELAHNLKPRKCLDYKTAYEVFFKKKVALVS